MTDPYTPDERAELETLASADDMTPEQWERLQELLEIGNDQPSRPMPTWWQNREARRRRPLDSAVAARGEGGRVLLTIACHGRRIGEIRASSAGPVFVANVHLDASLEQRNEIYGRRLRRGQPPGFLARGLSVVLLDDPGEDSPAAECRECGRYEFTVEALRVALRRPGKRVGARDL